MGEDSTKFLPELTVISRPSRRGVNSGSSATTEMLPEVLSSKIEPSLLYTSPLTRISGARIWSCRKSALLPSGAVAMTGLADTTPVDT